MASLNDLVFDDGLNVLDNNTENLYILSGDPGVVWASLAALILGDKAAPTIAAPSDRGAGGREVIISAITDGDVTATGTATHWALTDDSATEILASGELASSQAVTSGNVFTLTQFTIGVPDPA